MPVRRWFEAAREVPGAPATRAVRVEAGEWLEAARDVAAAGGRLLALWGTPEAAAGATVRAAFVVPGGTLVVELPVADTRADPAWPGMEAIFPAASRMQRAVHDLLGVRSSDPDRRPWLRHDAWPADLHPLAAPERGAMPPSGPPVIDSYEVIRVRGEGVHEIPVGPVHAGIIEPGHFRFSVVGEKVLRLEERLGYVHKGIERRFAGMPILDGHRLAARVSGDSAVAYSWAYCQALEGMSGCAVPPRATWLRALFLELERIANHLGDLGALGNDAGFAFGLVQFSRLKEELLRAVAAAFGQRYLMDVVVPGGTAVDLAPEAADRLRGRVATTARDVRALREIYDEHSGVRDRFLGTGRLTPALAAQLGVLGLAARASGQPLDLRVDLPCEPYAELAPVRALSEEGDVAARVAVRFDELLESCRLVARILSAMPAGPHRAPLESPAEGSFGLGLIEGWRGPVLVALEAGPEGTIRRCHPHDPSWQNWPALEYAILDNIVPDFPLINKSFNLSYSGHDL